MKPPVVVQALDGRWNFGQPEIEEALRGEEHGVYDSAADATQAAMIVTAVTDDETEGL